MIKNLCIHIGDHKSGTTSIQMALVDPTLRIDGNPVCYPTQRSHNGIAQRIVKKDNPVFLNKRLTEIAAKFQNTDAEWGFLSAEEFEGFHAETLYDILKTWFPNYLETVQIVAYVRPHAQRLVSNYAEDVKVGCFTGDLRDYFHHEVNTKRFIYTPRFESWRNVFGPRFHLRPMLRDQLIGGDVCLDFLSMVCGTTDIQMAQPKNTNTSLGLEDLAALRAMHLTCSELPPNWRHALGWHWQTLIGEMPNRSKSTPITLDERLAKDVFATYHDDAFELDRTFWGGNQMLESLQRDVLKTVPVAQSIKAENHFSDAELHRLKVMARLIADMASLTPSKQVEHIRNLTTEILLK